MAKTEYVTKKIPRHLAPRIRMLKARYELSGGKVTEGQIIALAIARLEEEEEKKKLYTLMDLAGIVKLKKKIHPKEIDRIVYGV